MLLFLNNILGIFGSCPSIKQIRGIPRHIADLNGPESRQRKMYF